jgi:general secretion pathway protein G
VKPWMHARRLDNRASPTIVSAVMLPPTPFSSRRNLRPVRSAIRGFTMMELLVVIGILALLATLAISNVGSTFGSAQSSTAELFVKQSMKTSLFSYSMHMSGYPSTTEGLQALVAAPANKSDSWRGPYIEGGKVPVDPWGEPYQYRYPAVKNKTKGMYDLFSKGPDKIEGNEDDIGNWDKETAPPK